MKTLIKVGGRFLLKKILQKHKRLRLFLITGKKSYEKSGASKIIDSLNSLEHFHRESISTQTIEFEEVVKLKKNLIKNKSNVIVAIGGGAVIDMAKLVNIFNEKKKENIALLSKPKKKSKFLPLYVLPTTSGTGSEETCFATIYYKEKKYSIIHPKLRPTFSIVDPELCYSLPSFVTACSGFDAFSQCIESYWSISSTTRSRRYAAEGIDIIKNNLFNAVKGESNKSKQKMSRGANFSGKAINITKTTAPHALSYEITRSLGLPHGYAVALLVGRFFEINEKSQNVRYPMTLKKKRMRINKLFNLMGVSNAQEAQNQWYDLMKKCGLQTNFKILGLRDKKNIEKFIENVNLERLQNHPIQLQKKELEKVFTEF